MSREDDNLVLSSEDSSSDLELGLSLSLTPSSSHSPPPSQVVGWPPLGAYRMSSYNSNAKSSATEVFNSTVEKSKSNSAVIRKSADRGTGNNHIVSKEKANLRNSLFVKVKMDGIPIGRKVDLSAHDSYETLAHTLEEMFNEPTTVFTCKGPNGNDHGIVIGVDGQSKMLDGTSNFVLTYEDKEGDWMLVGDVPWWMFLSSVRKLRIMRTSEATGLDAVYSNFLGIVVYHLEGTGIINFHVMLAIKGFAVCE
ncbi:hypothetical protein RJT34_18898 [Clitoria ternatea]|uniref:Auxin-induced protein n=1 Tax=Clitoria ternatea TaxID=43366 RepID=A0AAN9IQ07_CLITE